MKNLPILFISSLLVLSAAACQNPSRTSQTAPPGTDVSQTQAPNTEEVQEAQEDAQDELRRRQLNSNIRASEERNNALNEGSATDRDKGDIASEVSSKLEANIPRGSLTVDASENGTVTVAGTVTNDKELAKIEPLAKEIKGVNNVIVKATIAKPTTTN